MGTTCWPVSTEDVGQQTSLTSKASLVTLKSRPECSRACQGYHQDLQRVVGNRRDEDRVVYLLASLSETYDMLVIALEAKPDVPNMEYVIERLLYEEQKMRDRDTSAITHGGIKDEVMMVKQKRRGPRCHYCKKLGHIQRNCHEQEKKFEGSSQQKKRMRHRVNTTEARSRDDNSDSDEVGLVIRHALSAGVDYKSFGDGNLSYMP